MLRVDLLDGREIHGVDRGGNTDVFIPDWSSTHGILLGKSDPFVVFQLNGQRVFKSQTKKKTLAPDWNETFTAQVVSVVTIT